MLNQEKWRKSTRVMRVAVLTVAAFVMSACGMIYDYDNCPDAFRIASDWREAPDAYPEGMAYMFFSTVGSDCWRYDLPGRSGGRIPLPDGRYKALCFNDDMSGLYISEPDAGYEAMKVWTPAADLPGVHEADDPEAPGATTLDGQPVVASPGQIWSQAIPSMSLTPSAVTWTPSGGTETTSPDLLMTFCPRPIIPTYTCEITDISNLSGVRAMSGALSGLAAGMRLSDLVRDSEAVVMPIAMRRASGASTRGTGHTFGLPATAEEIPCRLWFFVWLTDGTRLRYVFDVSDQVRRAPDPMNVYIKVGGIDLPESHPGAQGAFDVSVDGWIETIINIRR